jgi:sec-independent protein translocase protein TatA
VFALLCVNAEETIMFGLLTMGPMEWGIILLLALLLFGSRLPKIARSMGRGVTEFKAGLKDGETSDPRS